MGMLKTLLGEPLVHFLIVGLALFMLVDRISSQSDGHVISVTRSEITAMKEEWLRLWRRPANQQDLDGLIDSKVREELYYREGLRLGLDRGDAVVRNRLIQKMKFLQDQQLAEPSKQQLQDWLLQHKRDYPDQSLYSFRQVFLGDEVSQSRLEETRLRLQLGDHSADDVSQNLLVPRQMKAVNSDQISRSFGQNFSQGLQSLTPGSWSGPVLSSFGVHLVKIEEINILSMSLDSQGMLQKLTNDWLNDQREQADQRYVASLLDRYDVDIQSD
jgi:peptidyl-prolyl cis-trans isomerase C